MAAIDLAHVFRDDTLLSCQWADMHRSTNFSPVQRLHLAILRDAILCILRPGGKPMAKQMRKADAQQWLLGAPDCHIPFETVCWALGLDDSEGFRQRILTAIARYKPRSHVTRPRGKSNGVTAPSFR